MKKINKKSGFTLVELMVVAAIIAILAAIIIPLLSKNKESAVAAEGKTLAGAIMNAAKSQYARTGSFPDYSTLDDTVLKTDIGNTDWSCTDLSGPTPAVVEMTTSGNNGFSGTVTLQDGDWTDALTPDS